MDISLTPNNEKFLQNKIAEGIYNSISEAVNAMLNVAITGQCISQERLDALKADIQKGIDEFDAGQYSEGLAFFDDLIAEYE